MSTRGDWTRFPIVAIAVGLACALASSCGGAKGVGADAAREAQSSGRDARAADASAVPLASCRFKCKADIDCCARLGLGAGCPTTYPNRATCNLPVGLCEWHWNCEQESDCKAAKGDAYSCIAPAGSTHGFCRKQCATADDCAGEATLYDPTGQTCTEGRCYGNGTPATDAGFHGVDPPAPAPPCQTDQSCAASLTNPPIGSVGGGKRCQKATGRCLACIADADCAGNPVGTVCDLANGQCACRDGSSCPSDLVCGY